MPTFTQQQKIRLAILVNLMLPLAGLSTDIYLPSLPAMSHFFGVDKYWVQLTITVYAFGLSLAQLVAGPISDALGRRKLLLVAAILQLFAVLLILSAASITWIIVLRFIHGCGAGLLMVPTRAILNDIFSGDELKKHFNYATISFALAPIVAPFIGGYIQHYFGWQMNFYVLLAYVVMVLMLLLFVLPETIAAKHKLTLAGIMSNYKVVVTNRYFVLVTLLLGMGFGYVAIFNVTGPFIIQSQMHKTAIEYGHMALLLGVAWFVGNLCNRLLFHVNKDKKSLFALCMVVASAASMLIVTTMGYYNLLVLVAPVFIMILFCGMIFPIYVSECLSLFPTMAASANGVLFASTWLSFSLFTAVGVLLKLHSLIPLALAYCLIGLLQLALYSLRIKKYHGAE